MPNPARQHPPVKLTKGVIDRLKPGPKDQFIWDAQDKGFGAKISPAGKVTFIVQGRLTPTSGAIRITVGAYGIFTPDEAREVAREHLRSLRKGVDPRDEKRKDEAQAITLRQVADAFFARPGMLKATTRDEMDRHLTTAFPKWQHRAIASITPEDCRKRFEEIATKGLRKKPAPAPGSAASAFVILRTLFNWAKDEYQTLDGGTIIARNPVSVLKKELANHASKVRTRHIDRRDVGKFWHGLTTARQNPAFSADTRAGLDLVMFLLLTGTRRNEGAKLTWDRVNLDDTDPANNWFHLPDPKNKNPVWLPLSSQAVAILKARQAANDSAPTKSRFVFPSRGASGHIRDTRAPLERFATVIGMERLSAHDLRRTFVTLGVKACRLDIAKLELLTNHVPQGVTARHYLETSDLRDYHPEVQAIGDYIELEAAKASGANVVPLADRA
jgi:integrase